MSIFSKTGDEPHYSEFASTRRLVLLTSVLFLCLLLWQSYSASHVHQQYQEALMDDVAEDVLSEVQSYFQRMRREIDLFQRRHHDAISNLYGKRSQATKDEYFPTLHALKDELAHTRLFALIDENGDGLLKHITGDFLPSCKEEVTSTVINGTQEQLFLHRSETSVHFDLLQPLIASPNHKAYFFTAFNPVVLENILKRYQLPHQQLFLMRSDNLGKIELSSEHLPSAPHKMVMSAEELNSFSFIKAIPGTRWQIAIRLAPEYSSRLYIDGLFKAIIIWVLLTLIIYAFYRMQKIGILKSIQMEEQLSYRDNHDKLTGLANRAYFDQSLSQELNQHVDESSSRGAVFHIDIDQFQVLNNTFGYATGDRVLFQLSLAIKEQLDSSATMCRLGNDEFAILLPSLPHAQSQRAAEQLRQFIQQLDLSNIHRNTQVTASIGVINLDDEQLEAEQVLSSLNLCVKLAKQKGRNRVQMYQSNDVQLQQHAHEMAILHDLSTAIRNKQLILYRQEIKPLHEELPYKKYEILVRMMSPAGEIIPPNVFIPAAEKYGLIKQLDRAVIEKTLSTLCRHPNDKDHYSINLSGASLSDKDTVDNIQTLLETFHIKANRISFEITETSAISHYDSAIKLINELTSIGCQFSLDDFGSGVSSFSYLQQLPVSTIKIDGAFVHDIDTNAINRIFLENILRTASAMNKLTVAEYVENANIERILIEIGIHYGQGYFINKPSKWHDAED